MTGDDVIDLAKDYYGEGGTGTVGDTTWDRFLNAALMELYILLPNDALKEIVDDESVSVGTDGEGTIPADVDRVLSVAGDAGELQQVDNSRINAIDLSTMMAPQVEVYALMRDRLHVRPKPSSSTNYKVTHISPPLPITNTGAEISSLPEMYHQALGALVASLAYAQEEDQQQAGFYRNVALQQAGIDRGAEVPAVVNLREEPA